MQEFKNIVDNVNNAFQQIQNTFSALSFDIALIGKDFAKINAHIDAGIPVTSAHLMTFIKNTRAISGDKSDEEYQPTIIKLVNAIKSKDGKIDSEVLTAAVEMEHFNTILTLIDQGVKPSIILANKDWDFVKQCSEEDNTLEELLGYSPAKHPSSEAIDRLRPLLLEAKKEAKRRNIKVIGNGCRLSSVGSFFHPVESKKMPVEIIRDKIVPLLDNQNDILTNEEFDKFFDCGKPRSAPK